MSNVDHQSESYLRAALHTLEQAYAVNYDDKMSINISRIIDTLREIVHTHPDGIYRSVHELESSSSYEINDFNSAI